MIGYNDLNRKILSNNCSLIVNNSHSIEILDLEYYFHKQNFIMNQLMVKSFMNYKKYICNV